MSHFVFLIKFYSAVWLNRNRWCNTHGLCDNYSTAISYLIFYIIVFLLYSVYHWAHSPLVSNVPSLPHWVSFQAIGSDILDNRPCWCPSPFPFRLLYLGVFPFTLHLPLDIIRVSSLRPTYLHPFDRTFTCWWLVSRLGTGSGMCV